MLNQRVSHLFLITLILSCLCCISGCKKEIEHSLNVDYSFFVAGHVYGKPKINNPGVHPPFKKKFPLIKNDSLIAFGVFTGDIVIKSTDANWDEIDADIEEIGKQIYFAPGNHDLTDRELYESRYGNTYYSFVHNTDLFIVLDSGLDGWDISGDQLQFLKGILSTITPHVDHVFVFFHHMLWWSNNNQFRNIKPNSLKGRKEKINFWDEVEPLFSNLPNQVHLICGDVGARLDRAEFMYYSYKNMNLIASGMGLGYRDNIVILDIKTDKTIEYRLIALNGLSIDRLGKLEDYRLR